MTRFIQLYTWWVSPGAKRKFCVVDKTGKHVEEVRSGGTTSVYQTTSVKLLEVMNPSPINYDLEHFWRLVDEGKLIEYIPGVTVIDGESENHSDND